MFFPLFGILAELVGHRIDEIRIQGGFSFRMDNTHEFVEKVHDTQDKDRRNRKRRTQGNAGESSSKHLPGKQHSTNK